MNKLLHSAIIISAICTSALASTGIHPVDWGFYGHRLINKMAVFILPQEMLGFFKKNIKYISEHAVDPDKRRYATKHEEVRHYIDLDHWEQMPVDTLPRDFADALRLYATYQSVCGTDTFSASVLTGGDTIIFNVSMPEEKSFSVPAETWKQFWKKVILPDYYEEEWRINRYDLDDLFETTWFTETRTDIIIRDNFSTYGIAPYYLEILFQKMTVAFEKKDESKLLRIIAEFGHYLSDIHVPLHTTENYNGQLTNQNGIHAFWESRIPELFAQDQYDFFVGKAAYIDNPQTFIWNVVIQAHSHVDSVLLTEKRISSTFPADSQFAFDERLQQTVRIQSREYTEAYHNALGNMVEVQMRHAIFALGSLWYTAWVNAGQPRLEGLEITQLPEETLPVSNTKVTRLHENE